MLVSKFETPFHRENPKKLGITVGEVVKGVGSQIQVPGNFYLFVFRHHFCFSFGLIWKGENWTK